MSRKILLLTVILIIPALVGGCSNSNTNTAVQNSGQNNTGSPQSGPQRIENDNFVAGTPEDLSVGKNILVLGTEGDGGGIISSQIIVGESPDAFTDMGRNFMRNRNATSTPGPEAGQGNFDRFGPEQFQNMTEEERASFRENMAGNRGGNFNLSEEERARFIQNRTNRSASGATGFAGITRLSGEILSISGGVITLKLEDGGSKLVFYSDKTIINIIKSD